MAEEKHIGIHSTRRTTYIGAGMTRRKNVQKLYWSVWERDDGHMTVQLLNQNLVPSGAKRLITRAEFEERYEHEPDFFSDTGGYKVRRLWESGREESAAEPGAAEPGVGPGVVEPGVVMDEEPGYPYPEMPAPEPAPAPELPLKRRGPSPQEIALERARETERVARADFGRGLILAKQGNRERARRIFEDLASKDADFQPEHKHMFNDFGISLRKTSFFEEALMHYGRVLELAPDDENVYHNMARIHYEKGDKKKAVQCLEKSLELNPRLSEARRFLDFITKQGRKKRKPRFSI